MGKKLLTIVVAGCSMLGRKTMSNRPSFMQDDAVGIYM